MKNLLGIALLAGGLSRFPCEAQVIISSDFTGVTHTGNTYFNIVWTGDSGSSSASSLQAIRIDNNGTQVRSIDADTPQNAGYLAVAAQNRSESWVISVPFTVSSTVLAGKLDLQWGQSNNGQLASPGFGFALYEDPAPTSNLNLVPFGGGANALGYAITGTVQPSGTGALSSAMTGNVTPVDASNLASPQSISLSLSTPVTLSAGHNYVLRVAVFENNNASPVYNSNIYLDKVTLSEVPEPSTWGTLAGTLLLGWACARRLRKSA